MLRKFHKEWAVLDLLSDFILTHTKGDIFEVGFGSSTFILNKYAIEYNRIHYICDKNKKKINKAKANLKNSYPYNGRSEDFIKEIQDIKIAIAMIDGEHTYETVMMEFDFVYDRLDKNGVIFMHDTYPPYEREDWYKNQWCGDVYKVRQEIEKRKDIQIYTWTYGAINCGLSIISKKEKNRPFFKE